MIVAMRLDVVDRVELTGVSVTGEPVPAPVADFYVAGILIGAAIVGVFLFVLSYFWRRQLAGAPRIVLALRGCLVVLAILAVVLGIGTIVASVVGLFGGSVLRYGA
jgi:hypothetical protein